MDQDPLSVPIDLVPIGFSKAKLDSSGRIKLPVDIKNYLDYLGKEVFVTTIDGKTIHIYPIAIWRKNEEFFLRHPKVSAEFREVAYYQGGKTTVDPQGRLVIPSETRDAMEPIPSDGLSCRLGYRSGCIDMVSDAVVRLRLAERIPVAVERRESLSDIGLV